MPTAKMLRLRVIRPTMLALAAQQPGSVIDVEPLAAADLLDGGRCELMNASDIDAIRAAVRAHVASTLRAAARPPMPPQYDDRWQPIAPSYYS